ncbi:orotidine-5'-phosphate decarboxylase [Caldicellulosiruptor morganii]|uniref:Orotidine 5'-phosphate decarboxylase n=1 Tax=Caldicellulosiruptor morganii TaxID=1387555 RepID=A0ABY7BJ00_9FIRM|nr:orotidine-5'-phosphate decarboxylase [Caldicellulosiruptor morganii]WAM32813.1 orotidine-5'-phosphate decarboxylase [Caldicellulosiruptor morganii]
MLNFSDRLFDTIKKKNSVLVAGIDTSIENIPDYFIKKYYDKDKNETENLKYILFEYNRRIIDAIEENIVGVKFQAAFFEQYSYHGVEVLHKLILYAKNKKLIVIFDGKRNDISSSAKGYSNAYIGETVVFDKKIKFFDCDAITVNPYIGEDGIKPFVEDCERYKKGLFVLVKTSNPSSKDFQDLSIDSKYLFEKVAEKVHEWGAGCKGKYGYSDIGAVVGATQPDAAKLVRSILPDSFLLIPGVGVQGGKVEDLKYFLDKNKLGIIVNSSRDIIYAYKNHIHSDFEKSSFIASKNLKESINNAIA